jgi:serine/threonine-protein kinase
MLNLYRHTGDGAWLDRARALAEDAARTIGRWSLRRDSLYKGEIGVALLLADLERPELSCMPLFDREP